VLALSAVLATMACARSALPDAAPAVDAMIDAPLSSSSGGQDDAMVHVISATTPAAID
jgi:hypothetical protein